LNPGVQSSDELSENAGALICRPVIFAPIGSAQSSGRIGGLAMLRAAVVALALLGSFDLVMLNGKYTSVALQMSSSFLRHVW
jgi:hypothetical protein